MDVAIDRSKIGYQFEPIWAPLDAREIAAFALAIGETNPVYFDEAVAISQGYRSIPAPLTYAFCLKVRHQRHDPETALRGLLGLPPDLGTLLHAEQGFKFFEPVCAGDTLRFDERI